MKPKSEEVGRLPVVTPDAMWEPDDDEPDFDQLADPSTISDEEMRKFYDKDAPTQ